MVLEPLPFEPLAYHKQSRDVGEQKGEENKDGHAIDVVVHAMEWAHSAPTGIGVVVDRQGDPDDEEGCGHCTQHPRLRAVHRYVH